MNNFKPLNKHILVELQDKEEDNTSPILIPEDAKLSRGGRYEMVRFIQAADDCERFLIRLNPDSPSWSVHEGDTGDHFVNEARESCAHLFVDRTSIEEIYIKGEVRHIVHQNYVVGVTYE